MIDAACQGWRRMRIFAPLWVLLCLAASLAATAQDTAGPLPPPQLPLEPAAAKAFTVLENHCARCHQAGMLERIKPARNFGNILRLNQLARDEKLVRPGNPDGSVLYTHMVKREMPYDVFQEFSGGSEPTADEIAAVREWIEELPGAQASAPACKDRKFITPGEIAGSVGRYIKQSAAGSSSPAASGLRFITLTHLYNACAGDRDMALYRQGVIKLLNSLSQNAMVLKLETIDDAGTIIKFALSDLGWDAARWEFLLSRYPYASAPVRAEAGSLFEGTATKLPYLRGDWLAYAATRPPLYYDLLGQPKSLRALQSSLGLDVEANIRSLLARRAGISNSVIAGNNRLIERHDIAAGAYWTTYDFDGSRGRQKLKAYPLGPLGKSAFKHAMNAVIYSLPNGFSAYYLSNAKGERLDLAPTEILHDWTEREGKVTAGISCMACHRAGLQKAADEIRDAVQSRRSFGTRIRDAVDALYPPQEAMDQIMASDSLRLRSAMASAGLDPDLALNGVEMVNALSHLYARNVALKGAAAEFGLPEEDFLKGLGRFGREVFRFKRRLQQGAVTRARFEDMYARILRLVAKDRFVADGAIAAPGSSGKNGLRSNSARSFDLAIYSDKSVYEPGDIAQFWIRSAADCMLTVINVDNVGKGTVIFPNDFAQNNRLQAGRVMKLPAIGAPYKFRLRDKGFERVIAICNTRVGSADGISHDYEKQKFTNLGDYRAFLKQAIEDGDTGRAKQSRRRRSRRAKNMPEIQARTAITLKIR